MGRDNNLEKVITADANVVRMNLSYGSSEDCKMRVGKVRGIAARLRRRVAILDDLQEPKIYVSTFREGKVLLNTGGEFPFDASLGEGEGDKERVGTDYKGLPTDVVPDNILLLGDDRVQLKILEVQGMKVFTKVAVSDPPSNNKGINKLGGGLSAEALTEKDKVDIKTAALTDVDYLTVSFPCCGEGLNYARRLVHDVRCDVKIVAEVERVEVVCGQGVMDDVILASDMAMAACGNLGVEIGDLEPVDTRKALIRCVRRLSRVVTTATQMIKPVIANPMSTCAEVMNVANAVLDDTDAVMPSAETAAGQYLSEAVATTTHVCLGTEKIPSIDVSKHRLGVQFDNVEEVTAMSAMYAANHLKGATAIITMTESGRTTPMTSCISSGLSILAMSRHECTLNLTALYRGVTPVHFDGANDDAVAASEAVNLLRDKDYLMSGDLVIVTQGDVTSTVSSIDTIRILTVE